MILEGTAYGRPANLRSSDHGSRSGNTVREYLRRYWHPVLASRNVTGGRAKFACWVRPDRVSDGDGRPGVLYPHCMHRGSSLFYGKVEADGIRCCYHGWKFDVEFPAVIAAADAVRLDLA